MTVRPAMPAAPKLDPREAHFRIPSHHAGLTLFLRYRPPDHQSAPAGKVVLYVHGGSFPSALSIAHRFEGRSWRDELNAAGFHVWGLDFHGFGRLSDPYPEMAAPADGHPPLGRAEDANRQIERAVQFIRRHQDVARVSIIAHSWGSIPACLFAGRCPDLVDRLVLFGPIARRGGGANLAPAPAWRLISLEDQWNRFVADTPAGEAPVLLERHFAPWGEAWLDIDPDSRGRSPASVKAPAGPHRDVIDAWSGNLAYDPALIQAPTAIIRGEWDSLCTDDDARQLFDAMASSPIRRDIKIARAGHLTHLEENRHALHRKSETFLAGEV